MASLGGIDAYMEQWLKTATKGNVRFTMASLTNRMNLHCDVCNVGLTCEKPVDANTIDYAVQEYVKLHAHIGGHGDAWECKMCGQWTKEPLTGPSGHGTTCKAIVANTGSNECTHTKLNGTESTISSHQMINGDIWKWCMRCGAQWKPDIAPTAVTADFKQLPSKKPLPMATGGQFAVIEHTPPPPRSAPVSDVFEDKGRKFR